MRIVFSVIFSISALILGADLFALTLQEKLALAKLAADDAAAGNTQKGRILDGTFNFEEALKKYASEFSKIEHEQETTDSDAATSAVKESLAENTDDIIPDISEPVLIPLEKSAKDSNTILPTKLEPPIESLKNEPPIVPANAIYLCNSAEETMDFIRKEEARANAEFERAIKEDEKKRSELIAKKDKGKTPKKEIEKSETSHSKFFHYENSFFYFNSDDYDAFLQSIEVLKTVEKVFAYYYVSRPNITRKINLNISAEKDVKERINFADNGNIYITLRWNSTLSVEKISRILSLASLKKIALEYGGTKAFKNTPKWIEYAMSAVVQQQLTAGLASYYSRICRSGGTQKQDIDVIFDIKDVSDENLSYTEAKFFFVLKAIESIIPRSKMQEFMRFLLISEFPSKAILNELHKKGANAHIRWICILNGEILARAGGIQSLEESDTELVRLAVLPTSNKLGERIGVFASDVFKYSEKESFKGDIQTRLVEIKIASLKMNPVYHNALVSLGNIYESALKDDEKAFTQYLKLFKVELNKARNISKRVRELMKTPLLNEKKSDLN